MLGNLKHSLLQVKGKGNVEVPGTGGLRLQDVWHISGLTSNLISVGQLEDKSVTLVGLSSKELVLVKENKAIAQVHQQGRLYTLEHYLGTMILEKAVILKAVIMDNSLELWH